MRDIDKALNDLLQHRGVKGMKWGFAEGERNGKRVAGEGEEETDPEEKLDKLGEDIADMNGKVGDGPLDMLKYILFGTTKKPSKKKPSKKESSRKIKDVSKELADLKSKVGDGPLDMIRYILTGKRKRKLKHSALNEGTLLRDVDNKYKENGRRILESILDES